MPCDERVKMLTGSLSAPMAAFRSTLATTLEQIRGILDAGRPTKNGQVQRFGAELGQFAAGKINIERFSTLFATKNSLNVVNLQRIDRAYQTLSELLAQDEQLFLVNVEEGGNLRDSVAKTLDHLGTAFGAARVVELSRAGRYHHSEHAMFFSSFPFASWNPAERRLAPPLIVMVDGQDLTVGGLAEFLDGAQKIALVVRGASSPAPLTRFMTPNTFVAQSSESAVLDRLALWDGPGIVALLPETAARFVHDPAAAPDRLSIDFVPETESHKSIGAISASQQTEELRQLQAIRESARLLETGSSVGVSPSSSAADPVDKLAAWLLQQADLPNAG